MADKLRVRVYNVRFGDAILISVPDRAGRKTVTRHILIDVGNVLSGEGGDTSVFEPVIRDVRKVIGRRPLDLYVMSHEHMDHVKGLLYADKVLNLKLPVAYSWLTASAAPDYYQRHPDAEAARRSLAAAYDQIERFLRASPEAESTLMRAMRLNNNPRSTADCVAHLRGVASVKTSYVYRGCELEGTHPFKEAGFEIWAPEEDTAEYYGRFQPMALGLSAADGPGAKPALTTPIPPPGVDAGAFYNLVEARRRGYSDNLLSIDRAKNNTSLVFCLNWRGWRLLFPGDAEQRSWKTIWKRMGDGEPPFDGGAPPPIHFIKVSHHGSHNGLPVPEMLDAIMPAASPDGRPRHAVVSTCLDCYNNVPDDATLGRLKERCGVQSVLDLAGDVFYFDVEFDG